MAYYTAVVLAAGKGTRMKSELPKVMHFMAGQPLIDHVLDKVSRLGIDDVLTIAGHGREILTEHLGQRTHVVVQSEQLGTGHAVMQVIPYLKEDTDVLILSGDQPLLSEHTIKALMTHHSVSGASATVLTACLDIPTGYGRILKNDQGFSGIIEEKDADVKQREINEINTGTYCFRAGALKNALQKITPTNAQGEYYLTDVFDIILSSGGKIETLCTDDPTEAFGINNRVQLAEAEDILYDRIRKHWMLEGVTIINPSSVFIDAQAVLGRDVIISPFTLIKGNTRIDDHAQIGPGVTVINSHCRQGCKIQHAVIQDAVIGENCSIGPYAYIRPGTVLGTGVKVGDFVEIKNSHIADGSKVPHLSYIGDSVIGNDVNIGAGTITCNYDGMAKHRTTIGDNVFVGSNTNFVAPVTIGHHAVIGAGSTITKDVPAESLAIERSQQKNIENYTKIRKK
ncbi:bifunctional UDP-N-acetylglucosamine diphosphorylase/glucosamine-1-phosphate N-acetyltransferase GlmU [Dehalobacter sp. DCM]|uniref:bifunctional UDP-N-acetylglucosamine diphosphorylase/glucosamine-1-phosphate N-acetyltransferase GlmU n=1 Tax=Dehalobacter sp. DCM TaxID=2907827 RepID=UPI0030818C53|nr:bifunctional UDP-N-acetylglucosamine diphosphorylase/glucosamine-1-phosphate N-acetyltransferase GlmU [Dehalobacter sp. DCM]